MSNIPTLLEQDDTTIAVVGATDEPGKYGGIIYRDLKQKGFTVFPINHKREYVDGDKVYKNLSELIQAPTIVNIVVPPASGLTVLKECLRLKYKNVWLQPGAENPMIMDFLEKEGFNYLANSCIMVLSKNRG